MNSRFLLVPSAVLTLLVTGCVGVGPSTQQGAVTGGTLGAIAGAIIGHNSRGGDALGGAILGGTVGAMAGGALGNSVDNQRGTLYPATAPVYSERPARYAGPPMPPSAPTTNEAVPPSPTPTALWIPGNWSFDGRAYAWVAGHWEVPPPNVHTYVAAHWERQGRQYFWVQSHWQ